MVPEPDAAREPPDEVTARMREDWNERAVTDARRFINNREYEGFAFLLSGCRDAFEILGPIHERLRHDMVMLEIGCGIGRMLPFFAALFAQVHGVDVAPAMIEQGRARLAHLPNVHLHLGSGRDLAGFPDAWFDLVLTFQVFQHIPDKQVIADYVREMFRVLKPGGLAKIYVKSQPWPGQGPVPDTWTGVEVGRADLDGWLRDQPWQLVTTYDAHEPTKAWIVLERPK